MTFASDVEKLCNATTKTLSVKVSPVVSSLTTIVPNSIMLALETGNNSKPSRIIE